MKKQNHVVIWTLVVVCFAISVATPFIEYMRPAWSNRSSTSGRSSFYFKKRQWLADIRTIAACVRYLYSYGSRSDGLTNSMEPATVPSLLPLQPELSSNLLGLGETGASFRLIGNRLPSRAERLNGRNRLSCFRGYPPMFAYAEFMQLGSDWAHVSSVNVTSQVPEIQPRLLQRTNLTPLRMRHFRSASVETNLQGA